MLGRVWLWFVVLWLVAWVAAVEGLGSLDEFEELDACLSGSTSVSLQFLDLHANKMYACFIFTCRQGLGG